MWVLHAYAQTIPDLKARCKDAAENVLPAKTRDRMSSVAF